MPFGAYKLGVGPFGQDPVAAHSTRAIPSLPSAFAYEFSTRTFPTNLDGSAKAMDPVTQRVAFIMSIRKGSLRGAPDVGVDWLLIKAAPRGSAQRVCEVQVRLALQALTDAKDIAITSVTADDTQPGRLFWELVFVNLREGRSVVLQSPGASNPAAALPIPTPVPAWQPTDEPGLVLALDHISPFSPSQWTDRSGLNNHATQPTGAKQPAVSTKSYNGLRGTAWSGANTMILPGGLARTANTTICVYARVNVGNAFQGLCILDGVYLYGCLPAGSFTDQWGTWEGSAFSSGKRSDMARSMMLRVGATASTLNLRTDGIQVTPGVSGFAAGGGCWLGSDGDVHAPFSGDIMAVFAWDHALSDAVAAKLEAYLATTYGQLLLITGGNSLIQGHIAPATTAPIELMTLNVPAYRVNNGSGGNTTTAMIAADPALDDILYYQVNKTVLIGNEVRNDIFTNGASAATAYANVVTWCNARKAAAVAAGCTKFKLLWCTFLPSLSVSNVTRATVNANLRANWPTFCDGLIDLAADTTMGQDGQNTNLTYYNADQIHPTDAGNAIIASYFSAAVNAITF